MLDLDWMKDTLKEAIENEEWDLVREVIAYLSDDDIFQQYKEDEDLVFYKDEGTHFVYEPE